MPIEYACRKCNKTYSNQEYEQSKFCKICGSFLLRNFKDDRYAQMLAQKSFGNKLTSSSTTSESFKEKIALTQAAESLRERIKRSKEYEVIPETEKATDQPGGPVESWIWSREYDEALKLEKNSSNNTLANRLKKQ